jgi:hypothetical protein
MATTTNKRPMSLAEQRRQLALLECQAHPQAILDRSRALPESITESLEQTINTLASIMLYEHMQRHP